MGPDEGVASARCGWYSQPLPVTSSSPFAAHGFTGPLATFNGPPWSSLFVGFSRPSKVVGDGGFRNLTHGIRPPPAPPGSFEQDPLDLREPARTPLFQSRPRWLWSSCAPRATLWSVRGFGGLSVGVGRRCVGEKWLVYPATFPVTSGRRRRCVPVRCFRWRSVVLIDSNQLISGRSS